MKSLKIIKNLVLVLSLLTLAFGLAFAPLHSKTEKSFLMQAPTDQASMQHGKQLYEQKCQWCHGIHGDGKGPVFLRVDPKPRDFTKGTFKIRTTQSGEIPTDYDIYRSITEGLSGTSMYAWRKALSGKNRWELVAVVKTFSDRFKNEQYTKDKVLTFHPPNEKGEPYPGDPGKADANLIKEGDQLYHDKNGAKCFQCHGDHGRGNGVSADTLTDDSNDKIWPADLTKGFDLRGGESAQDIYRAISTGLSGSPMPSYRGALDADEKKDMHKRWAIAYYVKSLQSPHKLGALVKVVHLNGDLPADPKDPRWDKIEGIDIPLAGQVIVEPREFTPSVDNLTVKGCYNNNEVAFSLSWGDRTQDIKKIMKKFPDAAEIQLPVTVPPDPAQSPKPYFLSGDPERPVDLWKWQANGDQITELNAKGIQSLTPKNGSAGVGGKSWYNDGEWKVVLIRQLKTSSPDHDTQFRVGEYVPLAFSIWDGTHGEQNEKKAISAWYYALLLPPASSKIYVAPVLAILFGIGVQLWAAKKSRQYLNS